MASLPLSPAHLMTLGMFIFGMDSIPYQDLQRRMSWRHEESERFGRRAASQFAGPGDDAITIAALVVPEVAGSYGAIDRLVEMADTGDNWPLVDGLGRVLGQYRIETIDIGHVGIMAGGLPRGQNFTMELKRVDG
ncbi:phage protein U [Sphingobium sp. JAI105]|uniref:phage tail protein n=1 Tax=Sphingobium sp. JAI105 TaxID=2787715 RepID=UPI001A24FBDD|nr:phage tail protein [Sphingobium sp. JAI105]MBG6116223.1 phage protein U [Sphingobium sp. JAI105]